MEEDKSNREDLSMLGFHWISHAGAFAQAGQIRKSEKCCLGWLAATLQRAVNYPWLQSG
ncbi:MAG: hypothetical protein LAO76_17860 [Acidobacteriia bacterium]|nr:hypothetical protein [Terriglobia bacterium]